MAKKAPMFRRFSSRDEGQGLIELIVALMILAIAIGALLTVMTASAVSLQRSDQKGTALTLAEKQLELYRNLPDADIRLDYYSFQFISASDPYMTASASDPSIPSGNPANQITDIKAGTNQCADGAPPAECMPVQQIDSASSPDHRRYEIDTYITSVTPSGGNAVKQVTVIVRNAQLPNRPILARNASTFSTVSVAYGTGKAVTNLSLAISRATLTGAAVGSIAVNLSGGTTAAQGLAPPTGSLTLFVLGPSATAPTTCTGGTWVQVGTVAVTDNGTYAGFSQSLTPAGNYWWYATYSGDPWNKPATSRCGSGMAETVVQDSKWSPTLSVVTYPAAGVLNAPINPSAVGARLLQSSGATSAPMTFKVIGPQATAPTDCSGGTTVGAGTTVNGDGTYSPTAAFTASAVGTYWWYASYPGDSTNNAAVSQCNGNASMPHTVVTVPPDTFAWSAIGTQTAGTSFNATLTANLYTGLTDTAYTGTKCITFSGATNSPNNTAPSYPAKGSCGSGQSSVTFASGVATVAITVVNAQVVSTALTATNGLITGSSNGFVVNPGATAGFALTPPATTPTEGSSFDVSLQTVDAYGNPNTDGTSHTITWSGAANAPDGTAPFYANASGVTTLNFTSGIAQATGFKLYNAGANTLTATEGPKNGSAAVTVAAGAPSVLWWSGAKSVGAGALSSPCHTSCTWTSAGSKKTFSATVSVVDNHGNVVSNLGSTVTLTYTQTGGGSWTTTSTPIPAAGAATTTSVVYQVSSGNWSGHDIFSVSSASYGQVSVDSTR